MALAAAIAVWPTWVSDDGVRVKCGTPVIASRIGYADGQCRRVNPRRLLGALDLPRLGAVTVRLFSRR